MDQTSASPCPDSELDPAPAVPAAGMAAARRDGRRAGAAPKAGRPWIAPAARRLMESFGIDPRIFAQRGLPFHAEARGLVVAGLGTDNRDKFLVPSAARAWREMRAAAEREAGIELLLISAFRSFEYQGLLIRQKLQRGMAIGDILTINAPPGGSEHHTGRAVDIGVAGCVALEEAFEDTDAFGWLRENAGRFGFAMTYPRGNAQGYIYEPWHWCWSAGLKSSRSH